MSSVVPKPPYPKAPITEGVIHLSVAGTATPEELVLNDDANIPKGVQSAPGQSAWTPSSEQQ